MLSNSATRYGMISIVLHWLVAPYCHKSIGILLFLAVGIRLLWRLATPTPAALSSHTLLEKRVSRITHVALYFLTILIMLSGYLISTADGRPIAVFTWFNVPALGELFPQQTDIAGAFHQYLAYALIGLTVLHALGALKHHFIDKDTTLKRMLGQSAH